MYEDNGARRVVPIPAPKCVGPARHCFLDLKDVRFPAEYGSLSPAEACATYLQRIEQVVSTTLDRFVFVEAGTAKSNPMDPLDG